LVFSDTRKEKGQGVLSKFHARGFDDLAKVNDREFARFNGYGATCHGGGGGGGGKTSKNGWRGRGKNRKSRYKNNLFTINAGGEHFQDYFEHGKNGKGRRLFYRGTCQSGDVGSSSNPGNYP